jgi:hypothetical protein
VRGIDGWGLIHAREGVAAIACAHALAHHIRGECCTCSIALPCRLQKGGDVAKPGA